MKNIELKARIEKPQIFRAIAKAIDAQFTWQRAQKDTYFTVPNGKLKLRQETEKDFFKSELIAYKRAQKSSEKESHYKIYDTADPDILNETLAHLLPVDIIVDKIRTLYMWKNVRIHFDKVKNLGHFLEFEAVVSDSCDEKECIQRVQFLTREFKIENEQLISCGYYDLMKTNQVVE